MFSNEMSKFRSLLSVQLLNYQKTCCLLNQRDKTNKVAKPWLVLLTQDFLWFLSPKLPTKRLTNCPNCADLKLHGLETLKAWRRWIKHGEKLLRYPFLSTKHIYNFNPQKFFYRNGRNEFLGCLNIKYMSWWKNWSNPMRRPFWIKLDGWG